MSWVEELHATSTMTEDGYVTLLAVIRSRVWKFNLPIPESFMNDPRIREELQRIVDGNGNLPLCLAADMNDEGLVCGVE